MKTITTITSIIFLAILFATSAFAQSSKGASGLDSDINSMVADNAIPGVQLGSLICEDAAGNKVLCSGKIEETILGIVTNIPYVTLNKPANADASKFIFSSNVSADNGAVQKGDFLIAGSNGNFIRTESERNAYAIALEEVNSGQEQIRVKVLSK